ncbi:hypothetical protein AYI70_g8776 [Smittium culicis]|uniref:Mediator of RNA polymerase II transcription subunit 18 n=1 Tax=Smittium culicis TaxID=133412 RepID=A0A1R1XEC8_9FUNG|nr:hypothetical protein AYI70_g8776 [Smittium culicis]
MSNPEFPLKEKTSILQYGVPEIHNNRGSTVRPITSSTIYEGNSNELLNILGYEKFSEHVRNGYWYLFDNVVWIGLYQVFKSDGSDSIGAGGLLDKSGTWVLEAASLPVGQESVGHVIETLEKIKFLLKGTAELIILDHNYTRSNVPYS